MVIKIYIRSICVESTYYIETLTLIDHINKDSCYSASSNSQKLISAPCKKKLKYGVTSCSFLRHDSNVRITTKITI